MPMSRSRDGSAHRDVMTAGCGLSGDTVQVPLRIQSDMRPERSVASMYTVFGPANATANVSVTVIVTRSPDDDVEDPAALSAHCELLSTPELPAVTGPIHRACASSRSQNRLPLAKK